jgi:preprotein translocase subunit YajC
MGLEQFMPFILVIVVFYFLLIRPQQAKAKRHRELVRNLRRGDRVVTQGGLLGTVAKVISETEAQIEIAEGVRVRILRSSVTDILAKTEPVSGGATAKDKPKDAGASGSGEDADTGEDADYVPSPPPPPPQGIAAIINRLIGGK